MARLGRAQAFTAQTRKGQLTPLTATLFDSFSSTTNTLTTRTASNIITPLANVWYVVAVASTGSTGTHSLTGWGITWASVQAIGNLYVFLGRTASPSSVALTLTYTGTSTGVAMVATALQGPIDDTTPLETPATAATTGTSATVSLGSYLDARDAALAIFRVTIGVDVLPRTGWLEIGDASYATPSNHTEVQFRQDAGIVNDLTGTATWDNTSVAYEAVIVEVAKAPLPVDISALIEDDAWFYLIQELV